LRTAAASASNAADEDSQLVQLRKQYQAEIGDMKTQIKTLEDNIKKTYNSSQSVKNSIDSSLNEAKEASNEFKQNLNAFGEFHDNYSQELQRVLQKRLDYTDPAFKSRQEIQNNRMKHIEEDLSTIELLKMKVLEKKDNEIRSIICKSNSTKLNVEPIMAGQNSTGKFSIYLNNNCLSYSENLGKIELMVGNCDLSNTRQAFELKQINDFSEYNDAIKQENTGLKKLVTKSDDIYYPFYLVHPENNFSKCVYVDDDGHIYVKTIESAPHGRFRTSQTVAFGSCPNPVQ